MASAFDSIDKVPVWQRLLLWLLFAVMIVAVWYYVFYLDAVAAREGAATGLEKAKAELTRVEERKANYLEELREHEKREAELRENKEILPMSSSAVDNLMRTFQQKARQVGMSFDSWTNESEQRQDVYARLPVKVAAHGTWSQTGEFFRQLSELKQPLSIENLSLVMDARKGDDDQVHPVLSIDFEAATYRALSQQERAQPAASGSNRPSRRKAAKRQ